MATIRTSVIDVGKYDRMGRRLAPWVVVGLSLLIYLLTLSRHYTADSLLYALDIENGSLQELVDPTHLALHPIGWTWYQLWKLLGWSKTSIFPLGTLNAIAGAICVGLVLLIALRLSENLATSMLAAIGFAVSGGTWLLSIEAEFVTVPLVSSLLVLYLLIGLPETVRNSRRYPFALGIVTAIAILMYANNIFLLFVVGSALWMRAGPSSRSKLKTIVSYLCPAVFFSVPVMVAGLWVWSDGNWSEISQLRESDSYGRVSWLNVPQGVYAFVRTIALFRGLAMNDSTELLLDKATSIKRTFFILYYGVFAVTTFLPMLLAVRFKAALVHRHRVSFIGLIAWSILYGLFAFVWVPGDISFWMPILVAWWLLVCMIISLVPAPSDRSRARMQVATGLFIAALLVANSAMVILPRRDLSTNIDFQVASIVNHSTESDAIVLADKSKLETLYLAYFSERAVIPVDLNDLENAESYLSSRWPDSDSYLVHRPAYVFKNGALTILER